MIKQDKHIKEQLFFEHPSPIQPSSRLTSIKYLMLDRGIATFIKTFRQKSKRQLPRFLTTGLISCSLLIGMCFGAGALGISAGGGGYFAPSSGVIGSTVSIDAYLFQTTHVKRQWGLYSGVNFIASEFTDGGEVAEEYAVNIGEDIDVPFALALGSDLGIFQFQIATGGLVSIRPEDNDNEVFFNGMSSIGIFLSPNWVVKLRWHFTKKETFENLTLLMLERRIRLGRW